MTEQIKIGDILYYRSPHRFGFSGVDAAPITGETSRSWVTVYGKRPKKGRGSSSLYTVQELQAARWMATNRRAISEEVWRVNDVCVLKKIAMLLGMKLDYETDDSEKTSSG